MNRKDFLSVAVPAGLILNSINSWGNTSIEKKERPSHVPPYLKAGDRIGITSPAGFISVEDIQPAMRQIEDWGLNVVTGNTIGKRDFTFGGTDAERLADFQQMLDDPDIKAIMCARGGYGMVRIIDQLDFTKFKKHPKWVIGFSDVTVFHCHINRQFGFASIHSKMCNSFPKDWTIAGEVQKDTILSVKNALMGMPMYYSAPASSYNRPGVAEGKLVGGNLRTIENLSGSSSALTTRNKILFVEDTGEYLYSIDRMFWNLKRTGMLNQLAGLIIGGFRLKPDDADGAFGLSLYDIVIEKVKNFNYPVCFDFPVGHQVNNYALKCGMHHKLEVNATESHLSST